MQFFRNTAIKLLLISAAPVALANEDASHSDRVFKSSESNVETQICLSALQSKEAMVDKAKELNLVRRDLSDIKCNKVPLMEFVRNNTDILRDWAIATVQ